MGVANWLDKSGNERHATQIIGANQPTLQNDGVAFDGINDFLDVNLDFLAGTDHQSYIVAEVIADHANFYGATTGGGGNESLHVGFRNGNEYRINFWGNDYYPSITSNFDVGEQNILSYRWEAGVGKEVFANGFSEASNTSAGNIGTMRDGGRIVCVTESSHGCMNVIIQEMIFVTGTNISTANDERITGYLAHKWGLESKLPGSHPYVSAPPSGWTPADIDTDLWLDSSDISTFPQNNLSDLIQQWDDLSGNNRHATQSNPSIMPEYSDGVVVFEYDSFMNLDLDFLIGDSHSAFFVIETPGTFRSFLYGAVNGGGGSDSPHIGFSDGQYASAGNYVMNLWANNSDFAPTPAFQSTGTNIVQFEWLPGVSRSVWANGNLEGQDVSGSTPAITTIPGGGRLVGVLPDTYPFMDVNISEIVFLPGSELSQTNYNLITGYLAHKWGLEGQLPPTHPYRDTPPIAN